MGFRVEEYDSLESPCPLQAQWNALAERTRSVTVFSTWEWQSTWWKYYGTGHKLQIIAVWDGDRLVGLLPLYVKKSSFAPLLSLREALLVGAGGDTSPDYLGPLLDPEHEEAVATLLAERMLAKRAEWDALSFTDMSPGPFAERLVQRLQGAGIDAHSNPCSSIQVARLPATWDEYLAPMHRDRRYRVRHLRRNALQKLGAQLHAPQTEAELESAVEDLIALHRKRWESKDESKGAFRSQRYVAFHREVIGLCNRNGWIRFHRVAVEGKAAAVFYCYRYRDEVLYFQSGFDPDLERHSLGQVLMGFAIETSIGEGARVFDLLKGEHAYKNSWSNDVRTTLDVVAHNTSALGRLRLLRRKLGHIKRSLFKTREAQSPSMAGA